MKQAQVEELWHLEEQFWRGNADFYDRTLAPGAFMVLPDPVGILDRSATIAAIRAAPRWQGVVFSEQRQILQDESGVAVLAYAAQAHGGSPDTAYAARCTSTYVRDDGQWLLLAHQQTPASGRGDG
jgi:hypothetical protein